MDQEPQCSHSGGAGARPRRVARKASRRRAELRANEGTLAKKSVRSDSFWMDGYDDDGLVVFVVSDRLNGDCALLCAGMQ